MRVFLHTRKPGSYDWNNSAEVFEQIPRVGEFIARHPTAPWNQVYLVAWLPQGGAADAEYDVEVYALEVESSADVRAHQKADADAAAAR
jgi:hypothetical protein